MTALTVLGEDATLPDPRLTSEGYERRTTAAEPRLSEIVDEYRRIGFEVVVVEHRVADGGCGECFAAAAGTGEVYGDVYVRRGRPERS